MIISKLIGGLGNQMFQYALGRNLALLSDTKLVLDISGYHEFPERSYGLDFFDIKARVADASTSNKFFRAIQPNKNMFERFIFHNYLYIKQADFQYDFRSEVIQHYNRHVYLDGYWQSEKYFDQIEKIIRHDFSLDRIASDLDQDILQAITSKNAVSVHVRRGDYVSNATSREFHGLCSVSYYNKAFNYIRQNVDNAHFFIFSDDIHWCKTNIDFLDDGTFVENAGALAVYKDLFMMTKCKHHIVANSSFSWWGAWLGERKNNNIVIAPDEWLNKDSSWFKEFSISTKDIIPDNWLKFKN